MFKSLITTITSILLCSFTATNCTEENLDLYIGFVSLPKIATTFESCHFVDDFLAIVLSDGSQWIITSAGAEEAFSTVSNWQVGNDIRVKKNTHNSEEATNFVLKNANTEDLFLAELSPVCADTYHSFCIEKIDQNGYAILTDDKTEWAIGFLGSFSSCKWEPKDHLVINKGSYSKKEDYLLINPKDGSSCWASLISWKSEQKY